MRMWMVKPKIMCNRHLLGEHVELHMFVGTFKRKTSLEGYVKNNCLEFRSVSKRHKQLVKEMNKRGMNHKSPLEEVVTKYPKHIINSKVDVNSSLNDLIGRCKECRKRYNTL